MSGTMNLKLEGSRQVSTAKCQASLDTPTARASSRRPIEPKRFELAISPPHGEPAALETWTF